MKCLNCNGEGLVGEKLCPVCEGFGYTGVPDIKVEPVVNDIEHIVTEEEIKDNNLESQVEAGEVIEIPTVLKESVKKLVLEPLKITKKFKK